MMTFTEVQKYTGLSRRVIQEYEKAGLATGPSGKNKYGYNMYDDDAVAQLYLIRMYRELGYSKKDLERAIKDSDFDREKAIDEQISALEKKQAEIEELIKVAKAIKRTGLSQCELSSVGFSMRTFTFDELTCLLKMMNIIDAKHTLEFVEDEKSETFVEDMEKLLIELADAHNNKLTPDDEKVMAIVKKIHMLLSHYITSSVTFFSILARLFINSPLVKNAVDEDNNKIAQSTFLWFEDIINCYSLRYRSNEFDMKLFAYFYDIGSLWVNGYELSNEKVQDDIKKMVALFDEAQGLASETRDNVAYKIIDLYRNMDSVLFDDEDGKEMFLFFSNALEYFMEHK